MKTNLVLEYGCKYMKTVLLFNALVSLLKYRFVSWNTFRLILCVKSIANTEIHKWKTN